MRHLTDFMAGWSLFLLAGSAFDVVCQQDKIVFKMTVMLQDIRS